MNRQFLYIAVSAIILSSCSAAYKTGQTPDDVYYSPAMGILVAPPEADSSDNSPYTTSPALSVFSPVSLYTNPYCNYTPVYGGYIYNNYCNPYGYSPYYYNNYYYPAYPSAYSNTYYAPANVNNLPSLTSLRGYKPGYNNSNGGNNVFQPAAAPKPAAPVRSSFGQTLQRFFSGGTSNDNSDNSSSSDNSSNYNNSNNTNNYNNNSSNNSDRNYNPTSNGNSGGTITRPAR